MAIAFRWPTHCDAESNLQNQVTSDFAELEDVRLYYEVAGDGQPVVLIHGFTLDRQMWDNEFRKLSQRFRVIRYDLRGHGNSSGVIRDFSHVDDLLGLLDKLSVEKAHIIGLSLGGWIATDFSIVHPERVNSTILIDPYYPTSNEGDFERRMRKYFKTGHDDGLTKGLMAWLADPLFAPACESEQLKERLTDIVLRGQGAQGNGALFLNTEKEKGTVNLKGNQRRTYVVKFCFSSGRGTSHDFTTSLGNWARMYQVFRRSPYLRQVTWPIWSIRTLFGTRSRRSSQNDD